MKNSLLFILTLLSFKIMAQAPEYAWVNMSSGNQDISADLNSHFSVIDEGNEVIYCASGFSGDIDFGNGELPSYGTNDSPGMYLAKYDLDGNLIWAKAYKNTSAPTGMAIDANGNLLICGNSFSDTVRFNNQYLINGDTDNALGFVVKLDQNGNTLWLKGNDDGGADMKTLAITTDNSGNVYVTGNVIESLGTFCGNAIVDGFFVIKLNSSGVSQWIQQSADYNISEGKALAIDSNGDCIIVGNHANPFALGTFTVPFNVGSNAWDRFIAKINASGTFQWAMGIGLWQGPEMPYSLTLDAQNNMYISGLEVIAPDDMDSFYYDVEFLEKRDAAGNEIWHKTYEAYADNVIYPTIITDHITTDNGDTYALFMVNDSTDFAGTIIASNPTYFSSSLLATVVKYDAAGTQEWITATSEYGYISRAGGHCITVDQVENVYYSGYIAGSMNFGPFARATDDPNHEQFILAKLGDEPLAVEQLKEEQLVVYPNPTNGSTTIRFNQEIELITITDLSGKVVFEGTSKTIDISNLSNGIYEITVAVNGEILQSKLVKH